MTRANSPGRYTESPAWGRQTAQGRFRRDRGQISRWRRTRFNDAAILVFSPLAGLRPSHSGVSLTLDLPKPGSEASSPLAAAFTMLFSTLFTNAWVCALLAPCGQVSPFRPSVLRAETGGRFWAQNSENGRNSVRRPPHTSLTDRNCEGFCRPGNRVGLPGLHGGGRSPAKPVSDRRDSRRGSENSLESGKLSGNSSNAVQRHSPAGGIND